MSDKQRVYIWDNLKCFFDDFSCSWTFCKSVPGFFLYEEYVHYYLFLSYASFYFCGGAAAEKMDQGTTRSGGTNRCIILSWVIC